MDREPHMRIHSGREHTYFDVEGNRFFTMLSFYPEMFERDNIPSEQIDCLNSVVSYIDEKMPYVSITVPKVWDEGLRIIFKGVSVNFWKEVVLNEVARLLKLSKLLYEWIAVKDYQIIESGLLTADYILDVTWTFGEDTVDRGKAWTFRP